MVLFHQLRIIVMSVYNIYSNNRKLKIFRDNINIFAFIFGPLVFLIYVIMERIFGVFFILLANSLLLSKRVATIEFYWMLLSVILLYIAIDCKNRYKQHLLSCGYIFMDKIIAANKLEAEIKYLQKQDD